MIDHLHWESLEQRRKKARVVILYKIIHNEVDINSMSYLKHQERTTEIQPLVVNTEATTKSKPEALPVSKTSNGNNKQNANRSGPQKTVKMTNSDNNNTDKSQSSIARFMRTPQRRLAANARTPPTPTEDLHDKTSGTKKKSW